MSETKAMRTITRRECPECGAEELPGLPDDCWDHPGVAFVERTYGLIPIYPKPSGR